MDFLEEEEEFPKIHFRSKKVNLNISNSETSFYSNLKFVVFAILRQVTRKEREKDMIKSGEKRKGTLTKGQRKKGNWY